MDRIFLQASSGPGGNYLLYGPPPWQYCGSNRSFDIYGIHRSYFIYKIYTVWLGNFVSYKSQLFRGTYSRKIIHHCQINYCWFQLHCVFVLVCLDSSMFDEVVKADMTLLSYMKEMGTVGLQFCHFCISFVIDNHTNGSKTIFMTNTMMPIVSVAYIYTYMYTVKFINSICKFIQNWKLKLPLVNNLVVEILIYIFVNKFK